ncbi:MAG: MinD/ParA family ATP-binding protein [Thermodesulfobacteriota bacterium]
MPKIISAGGGKGGIGKSFFSANIGGLLSMIGKKTLVIDLDTGGPNLHTFMGVSNPSKGLWNYFNQEMSLEDCIIDTEYKRLHLLNSKNCSSDIGNQPYSLRNILYKDIKRLKYDYIIIDLGAGINKASIDFFLLADLPFALFTSDPLSLENSFKFVHKVFLQKISGIVPPKKLNSQCSSILKSNSTIRPDDILKRLEELNSPYYPELKKTMENFKLYLTACKVDNSDTAKNIENFYKKFFGDNISLAGTIPYSSNIEKSVYKRKLYVAEYKKDKALKNLMNIVKKVIL